MKQVPCSNNGKTAHMGELFWGKVSWSDDIKLFGLNEKKERKK